MNKLPIEKRVQIITLLVEGNSLRSTSRIADVSIKAVADKRRLRKRNNYGEEKACKKK